MSETASSVSGTAQIAPYTVPDKPLMSGQKPAEKIKKSFILRLLTIVLDHLPIPVVSSAFPSAAFISHRVVVRKKPLQLGLFQDGGGGNLSAANAALDGSGSWVQATITNPNGITVNTALTTSPLYLIRGGRISDDSRSYNPGYDSHYWSSSATASVYAFNLIFNGAAVYPSSVLNRFHAFPLRCLHQS